MTIEDVLILGAGPAGLAAAVQLRRYGLTPRLLEGGLPGGLLHNANLVENYPGFPRGVSGPKLVKLILAQARRASVVITPAQVTRLDYQAGVFTAQSSAGDFQARLAVVASGTRPRRFNDFAIPTEAEGRVAYEVYPLLHLEGQRVVIVGAGDAAFDYALNLARKNHVTILNRGGQLNCLPLLWERASAHPQIEYRPSCRVAALQARPAGGLQLQVSAPGGEETLAADYLLGAIGREPRLEFLSEELRVQAAELERIGALYFIGDVKNGLYRQTAIAAGDALLAAMNIYRYLKEMHP
ncbi:MAG: NAD(P)/FAD-dependent oxidoreductase [Chloroflexi bacterium]|nr:NAD(P)/FAD-dependent oxidoreductase [Chloroflexota bacterium]